MSWVRQDNQKVFSQSVFGAKSKMLQPSTSLCPQIVQKIWEGGIVTPQIPVNMGHFIVPMEPAPFQPSQAGTLGHPSWVHTLGTGMKREGRNPWVFDNFLTSWSGTALPLDNPPGSASATNPSCAPGLSSGNCSLNNPEHFLNFWTWHLFKILLEKGKE